MLDYKLKLLPGPTGTAYHINKITDTIGVYENKPHAVFYNIDDALEFLDYLQKKKNVQE